MNTRAPNDAAHPRDSGSGFSAHDFGPATVSRILEASPDGIVVVDRRGRYRYANPAACQILGYSLDALLKRDCLADFPAAERELWPDATDVGAHPGQAARRITTLRRADGEEREIEMTAVPFAVEGSPRAAVIFYDVTDQRQVERKAAALAHIAATTTFSGTLEATLSEMAHAVVQATRSIACTIALVSESPLRINVAGSNGLPDGYLQAMIDAAHRGADIPSLRAFRLRKPLIFANLRRSVFAQPAYDAAEELMRGEAWDAVACVPILYQDRALGVLVAYYETAAAATQMEIDFLVAIAGQAAETIRLFDEAQNRAALEERQRLARDLHDSVSQTLFSAGLIAEVLPRLWERNPEEGRRRLEELRQLTRGALAEMRMLLLELRPTALTEVALADLLRHLAAATAGRARLPVDVTVTGKSQTLPPETQVAFYRIAQEALSNAARHSDARRATVLLQFEPEAVVMEIADGGRGFDVAGVSGEHFGLRIMRERAAAVGVRLSVDSGPGRGTKVTATWSERTRMEAAP